MHQHGSGCLDGPRRGSPSWWQGLGRLAEDSPGDRLAAGAEPTPARDDPHVRWDLVDRVRGEIANGDYETPDKWQAALDRLLDRLEED